MLAIGEDSGSPHSKRPRYDVFIFYFLTPYIPVRSSILTDQRKMCREVRVAASGSEIVSVVVTT